MNDAKYNEALKLLKIIVIQEKTTKKILPMIQKARCEIERSSYSEAKTTSKKIADLIESKAFENETNTTKRKCHEELGTLVEKLIEIKQIDLALLLVEIQFHLIKHSFTVQEELAKLQYLGNLFKKIAETQTNQKSYGYKNNSVKAKQLYLLYDEILNDMQLINNVHFKVKTKNIAWFMYYYGAGCNDMQDFTKSVDIYSKVIFYAKSNFGGDAAKYKVYGLCHHNYALALKNSNQLTEAKKMFEEALKLYEQASDWSIEQEKMNEIQNTFRALHQISTRAVLETDSSVNKTEIAKKSVFQHLEPPELPPRPPSRSPPIPPLRTTPRLPPRP